MASVLVVENGDPGPIAMTLAPLLKKVPDDPFDSPPVIAELDGKSTTEQAFSWVFSHCETDGTDLVVIVDIGEGIGSRLHLIDQLKKMPVKVPIVLVASHEAHLDDKVKALGFDIILKPSEMESLCHLKCSHPATDISHFAFIWPMMEDGITRDGMTLQRIIKDIIEYQGFRPHKKHVV